MVSNKSTLFPPFNSTPKYFGSPPQPQLEDRIQLALLLFVFFLGSPLNLVSLTKLRNRRSLARTGRLALLRFHLNIADLMILFIYATSSICHQITFAWRGGDLLCKLIKFLQSTSFQLSSNIIVCVALDRLFTIICGSIFYKRYVNGSPARYVRICIVVSWILAIGINTAQLFVWKVVTPYPNVDPQWHQCVTIWAASAHFYRLSVISGGVEKVTDKPRYSSGQFSYSLFHMIIVFWIPAVIIVISYTVVVLHMYYLSAQKQTALWKVAKSNNCADDTATQISSLASPIVELVSLQEKTAEKDALPNLATSTTEAALEHPRTNSATTESTIVSSRSYLLPVAISRMRNKTFRTSLLLVFAYFLCWTPYNALALWQFLDDSGYRRYALGMKFLNVLIVFNAVVNPFLYGTLKLKIPRLGKSVDSDES